MAETNTKSAVGRWQPIETAPKDGTLVDLWAKERDRYVHSRIADCWFMEGRWVHERTIHDAESKDDTHDVLEPTHWMPLPDEPTTTLTVSDSDLPRFVVPLY